MPQKKDIGDVRPSLYTVESPHAVRVAVKAMPKAGYYSGKALPLREALRPLVVARELSPEDFAKAFKETVVVEVAADNRVLNRLERKHPRAREVIRRFKAAV